MRISVHGGHNPAGKIACGASGYLDESTEDRKITKLMVKYLKAQGHTVFDDTVDNGTSQDDVLNKLVAKINSHSNLDLVVSNHLNAGGGSGIEVYVCGRGGQAEKYANKVASAMVKHSGLGAHGEPVKVANYYVLRKTNAPAILTECGFVDNKYDAQHFDADKMARAIVQGITGKAVGSSTSTKSTKMVRVVDDTANLRKGAGKKYDVVGTVKKGEAFTVVDETTNWYKIKSGSWIAKKCVEKV